MDKKTITLFFVWCWFRILHKEKVRAECKRRYYERNRSKLALRSQQRYQRFSDSIKEKVRKWRETNPEKNFKTRRAYRVKNAVAVAAGVRKWKQENRDRRKQTEREWRSRQRKANPGWRLRRCLSKRVWDALRTAFGKPSATGVMLGCSSDELKRHLEIQFRPGMSWENYGQWHVDHIRPCASFDLTDPEQQRQCFNFKNLQPLWAKDNLSKGAKYASKP